MISQQFQDQIVNIIIIFLVKYNQIIKITYTKQRIVNIIFQLIMIRYFIKIYFNKIMQKVRLQIILYQENNSETLLYSLFLLLRIILIINKMIQKNLIKKSFQKILNQENINHVLKIYLIGRKKQQLCMKNLFDQLIFLIIQNRRKILILQKRIFNEKQISIKNSIYIQKMQQYFFKICIYMKQIILNIIKYYQYIFILIMLKKMFKVNSKI
ncbi:hypothetical protein IMG5_057060 [Ichthyophthirius multifiliis]|uniref:Transmembrane protein n=1 Tax=Ichthyophthirius multifiliis TaxID=5932 RepID=G0QNB8_ICHMU|nr:hypothetical protein IMG5_057060 [Ichthyophthirius multifiliis]EGR33283.1 hypothetical protein IMG5_057060 [Ichthyophthirius multifiliis]|eukprot:XP_004037269.1 hypothetical protein IMG5_057060 [Ichthyophthirius multifiliis]